MTKDELIAELQAIPGNPVVLVSSDEEGNRIKRLADINVGPAIKHDWEIDLIHPLDLKEYDDEDLEKVFEAICLWP